MVCFDVGRDASFLALASKFFLFVGKLAAAVPFEFDPDPGRDANPEVEAAWSRFRPCVKRVPFEWDIGTFTVLE